MHGSGPGLMVIEKQELNNIIIKTNLGKLLNNDSNTILNELNYLNPNLDISQLTITEKDNISATIEVKKDSNNYFQKRKCTIY